MNAHAAGFAVKTPITSMPVKSSSGPHGDQSRALINAKFSSPSSRFQQLRTNGSVVTDGENVS